MVRAVRLPSAQLSVTLRDMAKLLDERTQSAFNRAMANSTTPWLREGHELQSVQGRCVRSRPAFHALPPRERVKPMWAHLLKFEFFVNGGDRLFREHEDRLSASRYGMVRFSFDRVRMRHRLRSLARGDFVAVVAHYAETFVLCRHYYYRGRGTEAHRPAPGGCGRWFYG